MSKKDKIISLYFEEKMSSIDISKKVNVVQSYITKVIKQDSRYDAEKQRRKNENKIKRKNFNKENMQKVRKRNSLANEILKVQHIQASCELSGRKTINNRAFRNWNSSIYKFHDRSREYRIKEEMKDKVSYAVPKKIKWD